MAQRGPGRVQAREQRWRGSTYRQTWPARPAHFPSFCTAARAAQARSDAQPCVHRSSQTPAETTPPARVVRVSAFRGAADGHVQRCVGMVYAGSVTRRILSQSPPHAETEGVPAFRGSAVVPTRPSTGSFPMGTNWCAELTNRDEDPSQDPKRHRLAPSPLAR